MPNVSGKSNMVLKAKEPEYKMVGNNTTPKATKNRIDKIDFVCPSKRSCTNCGIVVIPERMYFGNK